METDTIKNENNFAPIALFVYNRPEHTRKTVAALSKNVGAINSILYIFSDAARTQNDVIAVENVRTYIKEVSGFKNVVISKQTNNIGLAASIIHGVSALCEQYGRVIVLEDDLETSPHFLTFMNEALSFYENTPEVMHVSGCRYPVEPFGMEDTFFLHVPLCWGWATWQRAWCTFEKDISVMKRFNNNMIQRFSFNHAYTYWQQLEFNQSGKLNSWFIFWYANLFLRSGLALFPCRSLVNNIGMDDHGTNSSVTDDYNVQVSSTPIRVSAIPLIESTLGYDLHLCYFRRVRGRWGRRATRKILRFFGLSM